MAARDRLLEIEARGGNEPSPDDELEEETCSRKCCRFWASPQSARRPAVQIGSANANRSNRDLEPVQSRDSPGAAREACHEQPTDLKGVISALRQNLTALGQLKLAPAGDAASTQIAEAVQQLDAIAKGADPAAASKSESPTQTDVAVVAGRSAGAGDEAGGVKSPASEKSKSSAAEDWQLVVDAARVQQKMSAQPGGLANALNRLLTILWPRIGQFVQHKIKDEIEPSINESLPGLVKGHGVKFTKVHLGQSSPMLGPIVVDEESSGAIQLQMGIRFESDLDVEFTAIGIPVGISKFSLVGNLVVLMTPPSNKPPFFGGVQVYFPNAPDVGLNFAGAARMADIPGLRGAVRSAISSSFASVCVLPNRIAMDMDEEDDLDYVDQTYPEPIGVLRFTLWSGSDLIAADSSYFGESTSDPYVVATLGCKSWQSPIVSKTLNPQWGDGEGISVDFPVHDKCQTLSVKVFDYDFGKSDDLIGLVAPVSVESLGSKQDQVKVALTTASGQGSAGHITISSEMLRLSPDSTSAQMKGPSVAHLSFKIRCVVGLTKGTEPPYKVALKAWKTSPVARSDSADSKDSTGAQASSVRRLFQRKTTSALQEDLLVEGSTAASYPHPQPRLAEALQGICMALSERNHTEADIADILKVDIGQVEGLIKAHGDAAESDRLANEAAKERAATKPEFDEVVQVLLPSVEQDGVVELTVLDRKQKSAGSAIVPMSDILQAPGLSLDGPFCTAAGAEIIGGLRLKWLC